MPQKYLSTDPSAGQYFSQDPEAGTPVSEAMLAPVQTSSLASGLPMLPLSSAAPPRDTSTNRVPSAQGEAARDDREFADWYEGLKQQYRDTPTSLTPIAGESSAQAVMRGARGGARPWQIDLDKPGEALRSLVAPENLGSLGAEVGMAGGGAVAPRVTTLVGRGMQGAGNLLSGERWSGEPLFGEGIPASLQRRVGRAITTGLGGLVGWGSSGGGSSGTTAGIVAGATIPPALQYAGGKVEHLGNVGGGHQPLTLRNILRQLPVPVGMSSPAAQVRPGTQGRMTGMSDRLLREGPATGHWQTPVDPRSHAGQIPQLGLDIAEMERIMAGGSPTPTPSAPTPPTRADLEVQYPQRPVHEPAEVPRSPAPDAPVMPSDEAMQAAHARTRAGWQRVPEPEPTPAPAAPTTPEPAGADAAIETLLGEPAPPMLRPTPDDLRGRPLSSLEAPDAVQVTSPAESPVGEGPGGGAGVRQGDAQGSAPPGAGEAPLAPAHPASAAEALKQQWQAVYHERGVEQGAKDVGVSVPEFKQVLGITGESFLPMGTQRRLTTAYQNATTPEAMDALMNRHAPGTEPRVFLESLREGR
jgi:hypothetical protein